MRLFAVISFALVAGLLAAGCTLSDAGNVTIEERGGVVYVENRGDGLWGDDVPVEFELEQAYGVESEPEEAMLAGVSGLTVDDVGNIYVLDAQNYRLVSFSPDGELRWTSGRQGEGPGEFERPWNLFYDGMNRLLLANQGGSRVDVWTLDGSYERSYALGRLNLTLGQIEAVLSPDRLVMSTLSGGKIGRQIHIVQLGEGAESEGSFFIDQSGGKELDGRMSASPGVAFLDEWVLSNAQEGYRIEMYDLEGTIQRVVERADVDYMMGMAVQEGAQARLQFVGGITYPTQLASGEWFVRVRHATNLPRLESALDREWEEIEYESSFDFFDEEGRFLGSMDLDQEALSEIGMPQHVGPDGRLYTYTTNPYPQVRRFRVVIDG